MEKVLEKMSKYLLILLFSFTFFCLLTNFLHQREISKSVLINKDNSLYQEYQDVIMTLEDNASNYKNNSYDLKTNDSLKAALKSCISLLKDKRGIYNSVGKLKAYDVYEKNSFFENEIVNKCWKDNMNFVREGNYKGFLHNFPMYDDYVNKMIIDSNYVKYELLNNSSIHYNTLNIDVRDNLQSEYEMVQNNYLSFSKIILDMSNYLVNGDAYE